MYNLIGSRTPAWGHTYLAEGFGKVYALRSLAEGSALCLFDGQTLTPLGEYPTPGRHACHITLLSRQAVVADYTSGSLSLYDLDVEGVPQGPPHVVSFEGHGPHPERQTSPHIHSSLLTRDGSTLYVVDLGTDSLYRFSVVEGRVAVESREPIALPAGSGPRMAVESMDGQTLYLATELSDEVLVVEVAEQADAFRVWQRIPISQAHPQGGGHIALSPDGHTLYVSQRVSGTAGAASSSVSAGATSSSVSDGIAVFRVGGDARLTPLTYIPTGAHPRFFSLSGDGCLLCVACRDDNTLRMYAIDPSSGLPGSQVDIRSLPAPVSLLWHGYAYDIVQLTK